jgi:hypothetical protein
MREEQGDGSCFFGGVRGIFSIPVGKRWVKIADEYIQEQML